MGTYMFGCILLGACEDLAWTFSKVPHRVRCRAADYGHPKDRKLSDDLVDLLNRIFVVDPEQRITLAGIQVRDSATA